MGGPWRSVIWRPPIRVLPGQTEELTGVIRSRWRDWEKRERGSWSHWEWERERHQNGPTMVVVIWSSWSPISHLGSECLVSLDCILGYIYIALKEHVCSLCTHHFFLTFPCIFLHITLFTNVYSEVSVGVHLKCDGENDGTHCRSKLSKKVIIHI